LSKNLIFFDDGLSGDSVNRRWAGEECKYRENSGPGGWNERFHERNDWSNVKRYGGNSDLRGCVCGEAKSAVGMGEILVRVNVDSLNRAAGKDQNDAEQGEQELPATVQLRF
jgi:hypothetical protein